MNIFTALRTWAALLILCGSALAADDNETLIAFGDSTTAVRGSLKVYAQILHEELPKHGRTLRIVNAGIGGHDTQQALARFDRDVLGQDPQVVVIQFGINDSAVDVWRNPPATEPRVTIETYAKTLQHFVRTLKARGIQVVLMTPNPMSWTEKLLELYGRPPYQPQDSDGFNVILKQYASKVREIAKTEKIPLVDVYEQFGKYGAAEGRAVSDLLLDGMHPNETGHQLIAEQLIAVLLRKASR